jgi:hypothetical protein
MADESRNDVDSPRAAAAATFYSGALSRISRFMLVLSPISIAATWWKFGWRPAIGLAFGCAIADVNFHWLKRLIAGFADRAVGSAETQRGSGIVFRFLLRYVLMAISAYVILTVSPASLNWLLAGLFLPVAAILCEAIYESYAAVARGL